VDLPATGITLHRFYAARPGSIPRARNQLANFAAESGASADQLERVRLTVSEALTNVVQHAYDDDGGQIELFAAISDSELYVLIADEGSGLHPRSHSEGLGLGLAFMAQLSDHLTIAARAARGLEVHMRFALDSASAPVDSPQERGSLASATRPA
jgi:anti-sigma regulatory factor (Ser/Thr protein kinase)